MTLLEGKLDATGKPEFQGLAPIVSRRELIKTPLGRDFYRRFYTSSDYDFFVAGGAFKDWVSYRGEIYGFSFRNSRDFIYFRTQEKAVAPDTSGAAGS